MKSKGFTLLEMMVVTAMVGVVSTIAIPVYQAHITKTQVSEAFAAMEASKAKISDSLIRSGVCDFGGTKTVVGKYGILRVSGNLVANSLASPNKVLKTGCVMTYTFNDRGVTKHITQKTVVADLLSNSVLSKNPSGTVQDKYLPKVFKRIPVDTAESLAAVPAPPARIPPPTPTPIPEPVTPAPPVPPTPTNPTPPTTPPTPTNPTPPPTGDTGTPTPTPKLTDVKDTSRGCYGTGYGTTVCVLKVKGVLNPFVLLENSSGGFLGVSYSYGDLLSWIATHLECSVFQKKIDENKGVPYKRNSYVLGYDDLVKLKVFPLCSKEYGVDNPFPNII